MAREAGSDETTTQRVDDVWRDDHDYLVHLATRMLRDPAAAEDVVQEAFGRLTLVDLGSIRDPRGWLAVVVRRLCLDHMRASRSRESVVQAVAAEASTRPSGPSDPFERISLDTEIQLALAVVLDRLTPAERTAFVLHDVFGFPFDTIAEMVGRSPAACRQLATRARRAIRTADAPVPRDIEINEQRVVVERFIAACTGGRIEDLMAVLDPAVTVSSAGDGRTDHVDGAPQVARRIVHFLSRPDVTLVPMPVEDHAGVAAFRNGRVGALLKFDIADGVVRHITGVFRASAAEADSADG
jgi:RNA polymerase sigma-70 factor (ECF subfamily)